MSVRKRTWTTGGKTQSRWVYDHIDPVTGKRTQPVIRDHLGKPVTTKAAAERIAAAQYAAQASVEPTVTLTLSELMTLHAKRRDIADETRGIETNQRSHLLRLLSHDIPVSKITTAMLEDYATTRQSELTGKKRRTKVSGATVKKEIGLLTQAMRWARVRDYISTDPPRAPKIVTIRRRPRALTMDELQRFLEACGPDTSALRQIVEFAYLTGLRRAELFRLKWDEVDFERMQIVFVTEKRGNSHSKATSPVYLSERSIELLKCRKQAFPGELYVFAQPPYFENGKITTTLQTHIRSAARRAKVSNPRKVGIHTMRHTCVTHLLEMSVPAHEVAAHVRHRDGGALILRTYAHPHEAGLRRAAGLLQQNCNKSDDA